MSEAHEAVRSLLEEETPPDLERVRSVRRRLAADPGSEDLAQQLMEIEKRIEDEGADPAGLVRELLGEGDGNQQLRLSMDETEPFPGARRDLLEQSVEQLGGSVKRETDGTVLVRVRGETASHYLRSLYHWSVVDDG